MNIVTVDGPSGAGKGTLCQRLAETTGFALLDSGALYRLTALAAESRGIDYESSSAIVEVAASLDVAFQYAEGEIKVLLDTQDVTKAIRQEHIGMGASRVAAIPDVRAALLQRQRDFAKNNQGLIADGRDMGTVVFPDAPVKLFLTASASERANRRVKQLIESGAKPDFDKILADIEARDKRDSERASAPLKPAEDAILLDSTNMNINEVFKVALAAVNTALNPQKNPLRLVKSIDAN